MSRRLSLRIIDLPVNRRGINKHGVRHNVKTQRGAVEWYCISVNIVVDIVHIFNAPHTAHSSQYPTPYGLMQVYSCRKCHSRKVHYICEGLLIVDCIDFYFPTFALPIVSNIIVINAVKLQYRWNGDFYV